MRFILFSIVVHCIISTVAWLHLK